MEAQDNQVSKGSQLVNRFRIPAWICLMFKAMMFPSGETDSHCWIKHSALLSAQVQLRKCKGVSSKSNDHLNMSNIMVYTAL